MVCFRPIYFDFDFGKVVDEIILYAYNNNEIIMFNDAPLQFTQWNRRGQKWFFTNTTSYCTVQTGMKQRFDFVLENRVHAFGRTKFRSPTIHSRDDVNWYIALLSLLTYLEFGWTRFLYTNFRFDIAPLSLVPRILRRVVVVVVLPWN